MSRYLNVVLIHELLKITDDKTITRVINLGAIELKINILNTNKIADALEKTESAICEILESFIF